MRHALLLFLFLLFFSCSKEPKCPEFRSETLQWSAEPDSHLPAAYRAKPLVLRYESADGQVKDFALDTVLTINSQHTVGLPCPDSPDSTQVNFRTERLSIVFGSADSLRLFFGISVWNEKLASTDVVEADFYEWVAASLYSFTAANIGYLGQVRIITDLRNAERADINHTGDKFEFLNQVDLQGAILTNVYRDPEPDTPGANIYFAKGRGIVAFTDAAGKLWTLRE